MTVVWISGLVWLVLAIVVGVVVGRIIRCADAEQEQIALADEIEAVLEDDDGPPATHEPPVRSVPPLQRGRPNGDDSGVQPDRPTPHSPSAREGRHDSSL